jgi:hypothetical protein
MTLSPLPGLVDLALFPWLTSWAIGFRPDGLTHIDFHFYVAHPFVAGIGR